MRTALLFPGQGAPAADWRSIVAAKRPDLLVHSTNLLGGVNPFERFGEGTEYDQPAIYCASLAAFELAGRPEADLHAGHSLGEITALACAGAFSANVGLRIVAQRGRLMAAAEDGTMLAVGAGAEEVSAVAADCGVVVANLNSPQQTVLSGPVAAIDAAAKAFEERGTRAKRLAVTGAFHSPAMEPAADAFRRYLDGVEISEPAVPVLSGRTGRPFGDVRAELAASLTEPVRWIDVVAELESRGIDRCIEVGPGRALRGLVRRTASRPIEVESTPVPEAAHA